MASIKQLRNTSKLFLTPPSISPASRS